MSRIWSGTYPVRSCDMDARGLLAMHRLCGFLEDAAGHQADSFGMSVPQLQPHGLTWMIARLMVRMSSFPSWRQELRIETWAQGFRRLFAVREWRMSLEGAQIGAATSAWLLLDTGSHRPLRPQARLEWEDWLLPERALDHVLEKLPAMPDTPSVAGAESAGPAGELAVRFADVDMNGHANNTNYVVWCMEAVPGRIREGRTLSEIEIDFMADVGCGDRIVSRAAPTAECDGCYLHSLARARDGTEIARARTIWR